MYNIQKWGYIVHNLFNLYSGIFKQFFFFTIHFNFFLSYVHYLFHSYQSSTKSNVKQNLITSINYEHRCILSTNKNFRKMFRVLRTFNFSKSHHLFIFLIKLLYCSTQIYYKIASLFFYNMELELHLVIKETIFFKCEIIF